MHQSLKALPRTAAGAAAIVMLSLAPAAHAQTHETTLSNGMKIVVIEDRRAPTVAHMVWYRAGSIDEVNGRTGVAHVLEHLMFKGTRTLAPGEFSRRVAAMGGRENAFTSRDYTGYYQQIHKSRLAEVMALEADRMSNLQITAEDFEREIKVVMEERRLRTEDRAQGQVFEQLMAAAFVASPVRTPVIGWMDDLRSMTVQDTRDWYSTWYVPNNAILVVAGDVDAQSVFALAQGSYGQVASRALPARKPQQEPEQRGVRRIRVKAPAENPTIVAGFKVPKLLDVERDVEPYALEMLSAVLDLDENGRITRSVVRGARIADQAGVGYDMTSRGPALFILSGTPARGRSTEDVERAIREEIRRIAEGGVGDDELRRVKTQYVASRVYKRDSVFSQAMEAASLEVTGFSHADSDRILERIRAVSSQQVQAVARKYFDEDSLTSVTLIPLPAGTPRAPAPAGLRH
ncbi:MAG: insulinase family protein [Burkholderiaceae bacterium]|nr:insulinase family protein [Burkholderiaceae bacterium]